MDTNNKRTPEEKLTEISVDESTLQDVEMEEQETSESAALLQEVLEESNKEPEEPAKPEKSKKAPNRKLRYGTTATALTVIVVAGVILFNVVMSVLADRYPLRLDLTADKIFTLSDESVAVAESVTQDVNIIVYMDEEMFKNPSTSYTEMNNLLTQFYEALRQYNAKSDGHVTYSFANLTLDPGLASKYEDYQVTDGSILFECGERVSVVSIDDMYTYDEYYYYYGSGTFESNVEKVLAANVLKVTGSNVTVVTMFTGHGEDSTVLSSIQNLLELNGYTVKTHDITTVADFDEESTIAVIPAPSADYTAEEVARLREWMDNNGARGRDLLFVPDFNVTYTNLGEYISDDYGIEVTRNMVVETDYSNLFAYYPYMTYADVADSDYTSSSDLRVNAPYTLQLKLNGNNGTEAVSVFTFPESAELWDLTAAADEDADTETNDPVKADEYPIVGMAYSTLADSGDAEDSHVLVCGSIGYFSYLSSTSTSNEETFLNTFNGLTGYTAGVTISSKSLIAETADFGSSATKSFLGIGVFTIGLPAVLLVVGLVVFLKRRHL